MVLSTSEPFPVKIVRYAHCTVLKLFCQIIREYYLILYSSFRVLLYTLFYHMDSVFLQPYNPKEHEGDIYKKWEESGYFNPDVCTEKGISGPEKQSFSIILPPPNVTGVLHLGHALVIAIQDTLIRDARMRGMQTLWLPGTDHAAIATTAKVVKQLREEGKNPHIMEQEELLRYIRQFAGESHNTIVAQIRAMGASCDWSREAYTLDDTRAGAVREAFVQMYDKGLIYRGDRIVNWDWMQQTTISDDEIIWVEKTEPFYYIQYGPFVIGTVRPETKFGDKYVVMHPDDDRYKAYTHGQTLEVPWILGTVMATVIKDAAVDPRFGSGVMTITPFHDATDFDIARRHNLSYEQSVGWNGKMLPVAGEYEGLTIAKAREAVVKRLKEKRLLVKTDEAYIHNIATSERSGCIIEPQVKRQWFVAVNKPFMIDKSPIPTIQDGSKITLKHLMKETVASGAVRLEPNNFINTYDHWIDTLKDWCISRQIIFGHQVPAWYRKEEVYVGQNAPEGKGWQQDTDTLDTWFSSGLWSFSTLGWPEKTKDLKQFHPTTILQTGKDILFFWVARMILMTTLLAGEVPFKTVYLSGLIRDEKGRKMSKSIGNSVDPRDMVEKYGTDALRFALIVNQTPGKDISFSEEKVLGGKRFVNKLWNISRFVIRAAEETKVSSEKMPDMVGENKKITDEARAFSTDIAVHIKNLRLNIAAEDLRTFVWHVFGDRILEESKRIITGDDADSAKTRAGALLFSLKIILKTAHPFIPFVTETIWSRLENTMLMGTRYDTPSS